MSVTVNAADLDFGGVADEDERVPGAFLALNSDDDDDGGVPDMEETEVLGREVAGEDDIKEVTLWIFGFDPAGTVRLQNPSGNTKIKVYEGEPSQLTRVSEFPRVWDPGEFENPTTVYVEGVQTSQGPRDVRMVLVYVPPNGAPFCRDRINMTVVEADLRTDSNLDGDITSEDDPVEEDPPGKIVCVNDDDDNNNGVLDKDEAGAIPEEDDLFNGLIEVEHSSGLGAGDPLKWRAVYADTIVKLWRDPTRANPVPSGTLQDFPPADCYMEGLATGEVDIVLEFVVGAAVKSSDTVKVTVISVDVDGDADHDGDIDDANDSAEDQLPGTITLCNVDDDDEDGNKDNEGPEADSIDGNDDGYDLGPIVVRGISDLPDGWGVSLTLHSPTNVASGVGADGVVRVFSALAPGPDVALILGPGTTTSFELPDDAPHDVDLTALRAGDIALGVEGLEFAAEVMLRAELLDDASAVQCLDEIQLKVAPLILLGHLQSAQHSFVSEVGGSESHAYCTSRFPGATPPGVSDHVVPTTLNGNDRWPQDEFQVGFQEAPYRTMYVLLDSKRDRGLNTFTNARADDGGLLGPDFGHIQIEHDPPVSANGLDSFGNLEVSPPCTVGGTEYPFGRIYYGDGGTGGRRMDPDLRAFLDRQGVQSPVTFDSDWLLVGHVDEFMSIVPNPDATHGWTVLLASPQYALDILEAADPKLHIPRYTDFDIHQPPAPPYIVNSNGALLNRPLDGPGASPRPSDNIADYNRYEVVPIMDALWGDIGTAFGLQFSQDIADMPVLFNWIDDPLWIGTGTVAITPDLANGAVYDNVYIPPDQFLHQHDTGVPEEDANLNFQLDPGEDQNANGLLDTHRDPFHVALQEDQVLPSGVTAHYIDDWEVYHLNEGEVHCSSNEERAIPGSPKWWDSVP